MGVIWYLQFLHVGIEVLRNGVLSCRNGLPDPGEDRELLRSHQREHIQHTEDLLVMTILLRGP